MWKSIICSGQLRGCVAGGGLMQSLSEGLSTTQLVAVWARSKLIKIDKNRSIKSNIVVPTRRWAFFKARESWSSHVVWGKLFDSDIVEVADIVTFHATQAK
jgi:hypothetical protein